MMMISLNASKSGHWISTVDKIKESVTVLGADGSDSMLVSANQVNSAHGGL